MGPRVMQTGAYGKPAGERAVAAPVRAVPPNWPLLVLIAMMPLQNITMGKLPTLGAGINFTNVFLALACLIWWTRPAFRPRTETRLRGPLFGYVGVFMFSTAYGIHTLGHVGENHLQALKDLLVPIVLFFVVLHSVRDRRAIVWTLAATFLPLPYMFRVFHAQLSGLMSWHYSDDMRLVKGTFMLLGSNEIAAFYAAYTLMLAAIMIFVRSLKVRVLLGLLLALNFYCVIYSFSRGAYVAVLAGAAVMMWHYSRKIAIPAVLVAVLFSGAFLSFMPVSVQERFGTIVTDERQRDPSAESRFVLWGYAVDEWVQNPVTGIGFHTFHHLNPLGLDTHNYYVKVLTEEGFVGIILLLVILWRSGRLTWLLYRTATDPLYRAIGLGGLGVVAAFVAGNMFGDRFSHDALVTYFWVYLALAQRALLLTAEAKARA